MAKPRPKHRAAKHRAEKPRSTRPSGAALVAAPVAATVTVGAIGFGLSAGSADDTRVVVSEATGFEGISERAVSGTSRSGQRDQAAPAADDAAQQAEEQAAEQREAEQAELAATQEAVDAADTRLWTTTELNIWTQPEEGQAEQLGVLDGEEKVLVTGRSEAGREEVVLDGESRWVTAGYLSAEKPAETGLDVDCTNGTTYATPVSQNIVDVHRVVCGNFPEISTYGTLRSDGEHSQGLAVDIMVSGDRGWEVANFLQANAAELGINYLIYSQQIWSVDRSGEGWRGMEDRGSTTANHYDHVHVTTY